MPNAGQRDQRVRVFSFANASDNGWATSGYQYVDEYWGRVDAPSMREVTVGGQGEHVIDAVFTLLRDVQVAAGGLLKAAGRYYKISGVPPLTRRSSERKVFATYVDDVAAFAITGEPA